MAEEEEVDQEVPSPGYAALGEKELLLLGWWMLRVHASPPWSEHAFAHGELACTGVTVLHPPSRRANLLSTSPRWPVARELAPVLGLSHLEISKLPDLQNKVRDPGRDFCGGTPTVKLESGKMEQDL